MSYLNRVRVVVTTIGQGTMTPGAAYASSAMTMVEAGAVNGATYPYVLMEGNDFEIGYGVWTTSGGTLTRTVRTSKIAGVVGTTKMTLAGNAVMVIDSAAEDFTGFVDAFNVQAFSLAQKKVARRNQNIGVHATAIASAATLDLDATTGDVVDITLGAVTNITAITLADGEQRLCGFAGGITLTTSSNLIIPGGTRTTAAADFALFRGWGGGVVYCVFFTTQTGLPLVTPFPRYDAAQSLNTTQKDQALVNLGIKPFRSVGEDASGGTTGDANNIVNNGFYYAHNTTTSNLPAVGGWFMLQHMQQAVNPLYHTQVAYSMSTWNAYIRYCSNGTWSAWKLMMTEDNVLRPDAAQTLTAAQKVQARTNLGMDPALGSKTSAYTIVAADYGGVQRVNGTFTLAADPVATLGNGFHVYVKNVGTGIVTFDPNSAETIDTVTTIEIYPNTTMMLVIVAGAWRSIGRMFWGRTTEYIKFEDGTIIQWGSAAVTSDGSGNYVMTLPVAFPAAFYSLVLTSGDHSMGSGLMGYQEYRGGGYPSLSQFAVAIRYTSTGAAVPSTSIRFNWMAIGR